MTENVRDIHLMSAGSYVRVLVEKLSVNIMIGLYPWEQGEENRQRVDVGVELFVNGADYIFTANSDNIVDYGKIHDAVQLWRERAHTDLIENYLQELAGVCFEHGSVCACRISITKPDIFENAETAGVEAFLTREDYEAIVNRVSAARSAA